MKKKIYLAGCCFAYDYRAKCKALYGEFFDLIDPIGKEENLLSREGLEKEDLEVYNGRMIFPYGVRDHIVSMDKDMILDADYVVAFINEPTFGTIMEVSFAYENNIPVFVVNENDMYSRDVWLSVHADNVFKSLKDCFLYIKHLSEHCNDDKTFVLVHGKARSGKDTVSDYLVHNYGFKKLAFAKPIYDIVQAAWNLKKTWMIDENKEVLLPNDPDHTLRKGLQIVGTEMFRTMVDTDIWVRNLAERAQNIPTNNIVVNDWRFPNEKDVIKYCPGKLITVKVVRPGFDGNVGMDKHESESYDLETDIVINNDGSLQDLYNQIEEQLAI